MSIPLKSLLKRQCSGGDCFPSSPSGTANTPDPTHSAYYDTETDDDFWPNSNAGYVVRYVIVVAIILFIILWITFGIWHANRRLRRGQPLLWYHRWLVPSRRRYAAQQRQAQWPQGRPYYDPTTGAPRPGQAYQMHDWQHSEHAPPPPVYTNDPPPNYAPPPGPPPGREAKAGDTPAATVTPIGDALAAQPGSASPLPPVASHTASSNPSHP